MSAKSDDWIRLLIKFRGKCRECGKDVAPGDYAFWSRSLKSIKHIQCDNGDKQQDSLKENAPLRASKKAEDQVCFICGDVARYGEIYKKFQQFDYDTSQNCVCGRCLADPESFENYKREFRKKITKIAKIKI
jgi:hypothetical protein